MELHWESVVRPLLGPARPRVLVEVGVARGATTARLLEWALVHDAVVHGIDPAPGPGVDELREKYGERFVFHRALSLDALPKIRDADLVLIDGDHNWHTVHGELEALARVAREEGRPYPLTLIHDVDWPYGRRDMYHDPEAIPVEDRQPFDRGGLLPDTAELVGSRGLNSQYDNALTEGTSRNGVRTAVEDFLAETDLNLAWSSVPGFSGIGVIVDEALLLRTLGLAEAIAVFRSPEFLEEQCRVLEHNRLLTLARLMDARRALNRTRGGASEAAGDTPAR